MLALGTLAFASPWLLAALAALPVIWWLLRVTPPAPRRIAFPAIRLLLGLTPREETPARTPWWLILLRTVIAALIVIALAHPLLNPQTRLAGAGPVALVIDDGWPAARDWRSRRSVLPMHAPRSMRWRRSRGPATGRRRSPGFRRCRCRRAARRCGSATA